MEAFYAIEKTRDLFMYQKSKLYFGTFQFTVNVHDQFFRTTTVKHHEDIQYLDWSFLIHVDLFKNPIEHGLVHLVHIKSLTAFPI